MCYFLEPYISHKEVQDNTEHVQDNNDSDEFDLESFPNIENINADANGNYLPDNVINDGMNQHQSHEDEDQSRDHQDQSQDEAFLPRL